MYLPKKNLRQRRWLELLKEYDTSILYHPKRDNVVADALSRLSMESVAHIEDEKKELVLDAHRLARLGIQLVDLTQCGFTINNGSKSSFVVAVKSRQDLDPILVELKELVLKKSIEALSKGVDEVLRYQDRLCVLDVDGLRKQILARFIVLDILFIREPPRCTVIYEKFIGGMV